MTSEAERFEVVFDQTYFSRRGDVAPRKSFEVTHDREANEGLVKEKLRELVPGILKEPHGVFEHPYVVPGSVYDSLWDWDAYFTGLALAGENARYHKGAILDFLARIRADGRPAQERPHPRVLSRRYRPAGDQSGIPQLEYSGGSGSR